MESEPLTVTQPECARLLGVSIRTVRRLVAEGQLQPIRLHEHGHPRIRRADIHRLLEPQGISP